MPIPPLQEDGLLPPGLYVADMDEIAERFRVLLLQRDWQALLLKQIFIKRKPQEAFLVVNQKKWDGWFEFFSLLKQDPQRQKGLIEVKLYD